MKILLQRVSQASVQVDNKIVGKIGKGYLLLVGFCKKDTERSLMPMTEKVLKLKLFPDANDRMSLDIMEVKGEILAVSQFTLCAGLKKGRKPNFSDACPPESAQALYQQWLTLIQQSGLKIESGIFGANMQVSLNNDGPVTILFDSVELFPTLY